MDDAAFVFRMEDNKGGCRFFQNVGMNLPDLGPDIQFWGLQRNQNVEAPMPDSM
jgi:hypothetical protein